MKNFSEIISSERTMQGLSLRELSQMSGVPPTTIHHYENGVRATIDKADKILKALGISITLGKQEVNHESTNNTEETTAG